jgi:hypothetical protein
MAVPRQTICERSRIAERYESPRNGPLEEVAVPTAPLASKRAGHWIYYLIKRGDPHRPRTANSGATMRIRSQLLVIVMVGSIFSSVSTAQSSAERALELLERITPEPDLQEVLETNGFRIESVGQSELGRDFEPNGNSFDYLEISADEIFRVGVEKGRAMSSGGSVGAYHRDTGKPMFVAADENGDGLIDLIAYTVLDESGERNMLEVIDYEADGQADMRLNFAEGYFEIWHDERWRRTEQRDGQRGIVVDGDFIELEMVNNRWIVP